MCNIKKLKSKMVERDISVDLLSEQTGISRDTLYRRFHCDGRDFTVAEVNSISKVLNLSLEDIMLIFFTQVVA